MARCVLLCGQEVKKEIDASGLTVREAAVQICGEQEFAVPVVAMLNGQAVLRKDGGWETAKVERNSLLMFVELPLGGGDGGSNPMQMVAQIALIALSAAATWFVATAPVVGALSGTLGTLGLGSFWGAVAGGIVMIAGSLLMSAAFGQKSQNLDAAESAEAASPTYSVNASGNTARLNQAEGEGFGLMKVVPDYIAQSYTEYSSNDQYAHFVYGLGRGEYVVKQMFFGDTKFWDIAEGGFVDSGFVSEDGEEYSLKIKSTNGDPLNLPVGGGWSNPYPAVAAGGWAKTLRLTINFPQGYGIVTQHVEPDAYYVEENGQQVPVARYSYDVEDKTATILIQYAEIDDEGTVVGSWSNTITKTAKRSDKKSWNRRNFEFPGQQQAPDISFSKTVTVKTSGYKRWAVRVKNGSSSIPHPQVPQAPGSSVMVDDPDATVYETMNFTDVASTALSMTYQFVPSRQKVTLFPDNVYVSGEVTSLDLYAPNDDDREGDGWKGPYVSNNAGTTTNEIKIDYAYATGLGKYRDNGGLDSYSVDLVVEAQQINDSGDPVGERKELGAWTDTACTTTPQRKTRSFKVAAGRYRVWMKRTSDTNADDPAPSLDKAQWIGLRAVLPGSLTYQQFAIALKIKATNALSQQASQQFKVLSQRKLPVWTPNDVAHPENGGTWSEPQETRSWAAAVGAVCQEEWGGRMGDSQIDLAALWRIDQKLKKTTKTVNGVEVPRKPWYCDCYIDGMYSMWQLLMELCQKACVVPRLEGSVLSFVQDEPGRAVSYELNARNVVRGSFGITYNTWSSDSPDAVVMNYLDADAGYQQRDVTAMLDASESIEPTTLDWIGITDREHAFRVATRYAAMNRWRRITVTCQTEALGRLLNIGDVVSVNHPRFRNTSSGAVSAWNASALSLVLEGDFAGAEASEAYISLTRPDGTAWGPVKVASIEDGVCTLDSADYSAYLLQGNEAPFSWLSDGTSSQPTCYALHASRAFQRRMLVQSVSADDLWHYTLTLVNDAPEVSQYDDLPVPPWEGRSQASTILNPPSGLSVKWTASTGIATVVWRAVRGAVQYEVQHSADGVTWLHDGITTGTLMPIMNAESMNWSGNANAGTVFVRVAAISNSQRSQWAEWPEEE